jgi:hypothetical protein
LIRSKEHAGREQDLADLSYLRRVKSAPGKSPASSAPSRRPSPGPR